MNKFVLMLATGLGSGYIPLMPGTAGSAVGVLVYYLLKDLPRGPYWATMAAVFFLAVWSSAIAEALLETKDPPRIVIDEVVGMLVTLSLLPFSWKTVLIGFILFRVFDIWKPFPVRLLQDKVPGGWGVVADDVMAGLYANLVLQFITRVKFF